MKILLNFRRVTLAPLPMVYQRYILSYAIALFYFIEFTLRKIKRHDITSKYN